MSQTMRVDYAVPLYCYGDVIVPVTATTEEIHQTIEDDLPKYVTIRVPMGVGADAEIISVEPENDDETLPEDDL